MQKIMLISLVLLHPAALARADATWEQQAERLQNVSATLLDGVPFGDPVQRPASIEARAGISILPDVNPRVGAKKEKVPASPVHAIPTLQGNVRFAGLIPGSIGTSAQGWAGYLPSGAEKLLGIKAKLKQYALGAAGQTYFPVSSLELYVTLGAQYSNAKIEGAITAADSEDSFRGATTVVYGGPGVIHKASGVWSGLVVGGKRTISTFEIPADETKFTLTDTLSDSSPPLYAQAAAGWLHQSGIQVAGAYLYVPKRLAMPRLLLSYQYAF